MPELAARADLRPESLERLEAGETNAVGVSGAAAWRACQGLIPAAIPVTLRWWAA